MKLKRRSKWFVIIGFIFVSLLSSFILIGCEKEETSSIESPSITLYQSNVRVDTATGATITSQQRLMMSTVVTLSIHADQRVPDEDLEVLFSEISKWENLLSKNIESSELSKINKSAGKTAVSVQDSVYELINLALHYGELSDGLFDISIAPVVDLWGIGTESAKVPEADALEKAMQFVDYQAVELEQSSKSVYLPVEGMRLDLGGIAKGFIADRVKDRLLELGYESAVINLGGNVLTVGQKTNNSPWLIGVRNPDSLEGTELGVLRVSDRSVVSSGTYERTFTENGVAYHHILNPFTGYPENNALASVVILSDSSVDGDALSTTVFLMGLEKGKAYIETLDHTEAIFITNDKKIYRTTGIMELFELTDTSFEIMD